MAGWKSRYYTVRLGADVGLEVHAEGPVEAHLLWTCGNTSSVASRGSYYGVGANHFAAVFAGATGNYTLVVSVPEGTNYSIRQDNAGGLLE